MGSEHKWIAFPVLSLFLLYLFFPVNLLGRQSLWMNWTQNTLSCSFSHSNACYHSILCDGGLFNVNKRIFSHSINIQYVFWIFLAIQACKKETAGFLTLPNFTHVSRTWGKFFVSEKAGISLFLKITTPKLSKDLKEMWVLIIPWELNI